MAKKTNSKKNKVKSAHAEFQKAVESIRNMEANQTLWLKSVDTPAIEFLRRIAQLPPELQKHPAIEDLKRQLMA